MAQLAQRTERWRCPDCGYDLSASLDASGAHCPECGGAFSYEHLLAASDRLDRHTARLKLWVFLLPMVCAGLGLLCDELVWRTAIGGRYGVLAVLALVSSAYAVSVLSLARSEDAPLPWLTAVPMAMLVVIFNVVVMTGLGLFVLIAAALLAL